MSFLLIGVLSALVGVAVGWSLVKLTGFPKPKIGVKTADIDLNDPRYVIDQGSARAGFTCKNLDGVGWYEQGHIELPAESHACWTQTWAEMRDLTFVRRCACGAISMNDPNNNDVYWMDRNETRQEPREQVMIRYFLQGRYGPWYEVEEMQWAEVGLPVVTQPDDYLYEEYDLPMTRCVVVNTAKAWKDDLKREFPGLIDLIWFPDMRCGECGGRLIDQYAAEPDKKFPRYVHATGMIDRHGAWPVERWDD